MSKRKSTTKPGIAGMGNSEQYAAMFGKRLSSATMKHDTRPNRQRTRSTSKRAAIAHGGW